VRARLACLLLLSASPAWAQTGPRLVEEAATAPAGTVLLEGREDWIADEPSFLSGQQRVRYDAPLLRLVYSPAGNVEMDVEWVTRVGVARDAELGQTSDWGDVTLRAKVRLLQRTNGITLGARFTVSLPETSYTEAALGPNALRTSVQLLLERRLGTFTAHGNLGLALPDEVLRPHEQRDFLAYGLAVSRPAGARTVGFAEVSGRAGRGSPGADAHCELRVGGAWQHGRLSWDAALRRGLAEADGTWGFTVGVRLWVRQPAVPAAP
jgi:hypothetical protein